MLNIEDETAYNTLETLLKSQYEALNENGYFNLSVENKASSNDLAVNVTPKQSRRKSGFRKISPLVDDSKKIKCDICPSKFLYRKSYVAHMKDIHGKKKEEIDPTKRDALGTCRLISQNTGEICGTQLPLLSFNKHIYDKHGFARPSSLHFLRGFWTDDNEPCFLYKCEGDPVEDTEPKDNIEDENEEEDKTHSVIMNIDPNMKIEVDNEVLLNFTNTFHKKLNDQKEKHKLSSVFDDMNDDILSGDIYNIPTQELVGQIISKDLGNTCNKKETICVHEGMNIGLPSVNIKKIHLPDLSTGGASNSFSQSLQITSAKNNTAILKTKSTNKLLKPDETDNVCTSAMDVDDNEFDDVLSNSLLEGFEEDIFFSSQVDDNISPNSTDIIMENTYDEINNSIEPEKSKQKRKASPLNASVEKKRKKIISKDDIKENLDYQENATTSQVNIKSFKRKLSLEECKNDDDIDKEIEKGIEALILNDDSDIEDLDDNNYTSNRLENKYYRHNERNFLITDIPKRKENVIFINDMKNFMINQITYTKTKLPSTIPKKLNHLFTSRDSYLMFMYNENKNFSLNNLIEFKSSNYIPIKHPGDWILQTASENGSRAVERLKAHKELRLYIQYKADELNDLELKIKINQYIKQIDEQITSQKMFSRYSKLYRMTQMNIKKARLIVDVSQNYKLQNMVRLWNNSMEKMAIEEDLETIYENAISKNQLSGKDFTRWSHWCRFCLFLSDKNRVGTYNFDNESFILRLPLWFPKDYSEFNKLPLSYDPYEKPVGSPPPTNYAIKVTGNEEGIKLQEGTNIIITKKSAHLCAQYRKLKEIIQPNTCLTDPFFINEKNKALSRIQNTQNSLLDKMGKAIGLDEINATMVRQSAEATIQSREDMASRCKLLNMHSRAVGLNHYEPTQMKQRAEWVNHMFIKESPLKVEDISNRNEETTRKMDEEDEILRIKIAKEKIRIHKEKSKEHIQLSRKIRVKPMDKEFLQKIVYEDIFFSKRETFPNDDDWKMKWNRFIDTYDKNDDIRNRLLTIEKDIFLNVKSEVEEVFGKEWSGTKEENSNADFKIAQSIKQSFRSYEKTSAKNKTSYFKFCSE